MSCLIKEVYLLLQLYDWADRYSGEFILSGRVVCLFVVLQGFIFRGSAGYIWAVVSQVR